MTVEMTITLVCAVLASNGLWAYITYRRQRRDAQKNDNKELKDALKGLLHQDIIHEGDRYIQRGYITLAELEEFRIYLYEPYAALHGNGTAEQVWESLKDLPHNKEEIYDD